MIFQNQPFGSQTQISIFLAARKIMCLGQHMESAYPELTFFWPVFAVSNLKTILFAEGDGSKGKRQWEWKLRMLELRPLTSSTIQEKKDKCKNMNEKHHICH